MSSLHSVYLLTEGFPKTEMFGLTNQLQRASVSIVLNIAEGSSRTTKDFRHFLDLSRGSCYECVAILSVAKNRKYISEPEYGQLNKLARMISALKSSLR